MFICFVVFFCLHVDCSVRRSSGAWRVAILRWSERCTYKNKIKTTADAGVVNETKKRKRKAKRSGSLLQVSMHIQMTTATGRWLLPGPVVATTTTSLNRRWRSAAQKRNTDAGSEKKRAIPRNSATKRTDKTHSYVRSGRSNPFATTGKTAVGVARKNKF